MANVPLIASPPNSPVDDMSMDGNLTAVSKDWRAWFVRAFQILLAITSSGTTGQRPASFSYVGRTYFDTTLGKPIWIQSLSPVVWCDATGTPV